MRTANVSSLPSARLFKSKLKELLLLLDDTDEDKDIDRDFSSAALSVVNFMHAIALDLDRYDVPDVSKYGMALLCLELGKPDEALKWWQADMAASKLENCEIEDEEAAFFKEKFFEIQSRWKTSKAP